MPEPKEIGHQVRFPNTLIGLFRRGWWEIPEIMCGTAVAFIGIGLAVAGLHNYAKNDGENKEYKMCYTIIRVGDPRECRLKNPVYTEYTC